MLKVKLFSFIAALFSHKSKIYIYFFFVFCQLSLSAEGSFPIKNERTLSIIKPDAVQKHHIGEILNRFEKANLQIVGIKMLQLSSEQAADFYQEHKQRPFFLNLIQYMSSGPVVVLVLEGQEAIAQNRTIMGATDPSKAIPNTIRADFGSSVTKNAVHGSDSALNAQREICFFFQPAELMPSTGN